MAAGMDPEQLRIALERASMVSADREAGLVASQLELTVAGQWAEQAMEDHKNQLAEKDSELKRARQPSAGVADSEKSASEELHREVAALKEQLSRCKVDLGQCKAQEKATTEKLEAAASKSQAEADELRAKLKTMGNELAASRNASTSKEGKQLTDLKAQLENAKKETAIARQQISDARTASAAKDETVASHRSELDLLRSRLKSAEREIDSMKECMKKMGANGTTKAKKIPGTKKASNQEEQEELTPEEGTQEEEEEVEEQEELEEDSAAPAISNRKKQPESKNGKVGHRGKSGGPTAKAKSRAEKEVTKGLVKKRIQGVRRSMGQVQMLSWIFGAVILVQAMVLAYWYTV